MSYTTMYRMPQEGPLEEIKEYKNAWGSAPIVWNALFDKWIKDPDREYDTWMMADPERSKKFWALAGDERLPDADRIVMASTYDRAVVPTEMLGRFAEALREFSARHMTTGGVSHLLTWARDIDAMVEDGSMDGFVGICFNQTSVSDTWHISDDEDEWRLYDPSKDEGHWPISDIFE